MNEELNAESVRPKAEEVKAAVEYTTALLDNAPATTSATYIKHQRLILASHAALEREVGELREELDRLEGKFDDMKQDDKAFSAEVVSMIIGLTECDPADTDDGTYSADDLYNELMEWNRYEVEQATNALSTLLTASDATIARLEEEKKTLQGILEEREMDLLNFQRRYNGQDVLQYPAYEKMRLRCKNQQGTIAEKNATIKELKANNGHIFLEYIGAARRSFDRRKCIKRLDGQCAANSATIARMRDIINRFLTEAHRYMMPSPYHRITVLFQDAQSALSAEAREGE